MLDRFCRVKWTAPSQFGPRQVSSSSVEYHAVRVSPGWIVRFAWVLMNPFLKVVLLHAPHAQLTSALGPRVVPTRPSFLRTSVLYPASAVSKSGTPEMGWRWWTMVVGGDCDYDGGVGVPEAYRG